MKNFVEVMKLSVSEISEKRISRLAIKADRVRTEVIEKLEKEIDDIYTQLEEQEDAGWRSEFIQSLADDKAFDIGNSVIERMTLLKTLQQKIMLHKIYVADTYYKLDENTVKVDNEKYNKIVGLGS